jgi:hypothetical protein
LGIPIELNRYSPEESQDWDNFVDNNFPGSVLHKRSFMEYHSDRFEDFSICIRIEGIIAGIVPGSRIGNSWNSHAGLTFGGIITALENPRILLYVIDSLDRFLQKNNFRESVITLSPDSFNPSDNSKWLYLFLKCGYELLPIHLNQVLVQESNFAKKKESNARTALRKGIQIKNSPTHLPTAYKIIENNLKNKYSRHPTHTESELSLLNERFPNQVQVFIASLEEEILASAITFDSTKVRHIQYMGASDKGRKMRAQDLLVRELFLDSRKIQKNLSFGKSTSGDDAELNHGLFDFKQEYGSIPENILSFRKTLL